MLILAKKTEILLELSNGYLSPNEVKIASNRVAGGALWELTYNGLQYINDHDYGRQIQARLWFDHHNPTEAGDKYNNPHLQPGSQHGSPTIVFENDGLTQRTFAIPLDYNPEEFDGDCDKFFIYPDVRLGKEITLAIFGLPRVMQYETLVFVPQDLMLPTTNIQLPWVSLRAVFRTFYRFHEISQTFSDITPQVVALKCPIGPDNFPYQWTPILDGDQFGGLIAATITGDYAFGVLTDVEQSAVIQNGFIKMSAYYFYDCPEHSFNTEEGQFDNPTIEPFAEYNGPILGNQTTRFRSFLFCGSLQQVQSDMITVYDICSN